MASGETFLPDTLVLGAPRTSRSQFIPQLAAPMPAPVMPPAAALAGVQGVVRVLATVDSLGTVNDATILRGIPELDASAIAIVRRCRFVSLWSSGHRVGYRVVVPVPFTR
jgi:TonB family protein